MTLYDQLKTKYKDQIGSGTDFQAFAGVIPTGIIKLDRAIGIGGIPVGKVTQIYGKESAGKSTVAMHVAAMAQSQGKAVVFIDAERSWDMDYAESLGLNASNVTVVRPNTAEETLLITKEAILVGAGLIVIDSIPALPTKYESDGEIGDAHVGQTARLLSQASRMWTPALADNECAILAINQIRAAIAARGPVPQQYPGGHQWKHRVDLNIKLTPTKNTESLREIKFRIEKSKVANPLTEGTFTIVPGLGASVPTQLLEIGIEEKILKRAGSWVKYGDETLGQGVGAVEKLLEKRDICEEILFKVLTGESVIEAYRKFLWKDQKE